MAVLIGICSSTGLQNSDGAEDGEWIDLFNGRDLSGWILANPNGPNGWHVVDGIVDNRTPSTDIYTEKWFRDFDAHVVFAIYPRSNAGLYLLRRYEIQILDSYGKEKVSSSDCGALYREVAPRVNASKPPLEWQTFDITFRAPRWDENGEKTANGHVTVLLNGVNILDNVEFDEPTGSRKRYDEEAPQPILIQGDHGSVKFKEFRIKGEVYDPPAEDQPGPAVVRPKFEKQTITPNQAEGVELEWNTPYHAFAPSYRVYRGMSPDMELAGLNLRGTAVNRSFEDCDFEKAGTYYYRIAAVGVGGKAGEASEAIQATVPANQVATRYLSDASWARVNSYGAVRRNRAFSNKPMSMHGATFEKGIGVRGDSRIVLYIGERVGNSDDYRFRATVGLDDSMSESRRGNGAAEFIVRLDNKVVFQSGEMKWADGTKDIDIAIPAGSRKIELVVSREGRRGYDYANWAAARIERAQ